MPSLAHLLHAAAIRGVPFDPRAACAIVAQLCDQLDEPHGDLAPSVIAVGWDGGVTLERSGRAPSAALGYMAPERLAGHAADARSDLYALGLILYELVAGRSLAAATMTVAATADLPIEIVEIVERACARDPGARYSSAREMSAWLALAEDECGGGMNRAELAAWLAARFEHPAAVGPITGARPSGRPARRWLVAGAIAAVAFAGIAIAVLAGPDRHVSPAPSVRPAAAMSPRPVPATAVAEPARPAMSAAPIATPEAPAAAAAPDRDDRRARRRRARTTRPSRESESCPMAAASERARLASSDE
jgi:eukaryotic-like serine/threonine-protein kinase